MLIENKSLACFYYPTMVAFIDDNYAFLSNMRLKLASNFATLLYQNSAEAFLDLIKHDKLAFSGDSLLLANHYNDDNISHTEYQEKIMSINIRNIWKHIYNPKRFFDISAIVVDYEMPDMDGMIFCENLKDHPVRKLMLTGKAGNDLAVSSFNKKIIDMFITKDTPHMFKELITFIKQEQHLYFYNKCQLFLKVLGKNESHLLNNKNFISFFYSLCEAFNVREYYMLDFSGSFLLLDENANPIFFLVKSDIELENYYEIAKDTDAPHHVLDALKKRKKILFLFTEEDDKISPMHWDPYLYPAFQLDSNKSYFYAIIKSPIKGLDLSKVVSYKTFLKNL